MALINAKRSLLARQLLEGASSACVNMEIRPVRDFENNFPFSPSPFLQNQRVPAAKKTVWAMLTQSSLTTK